VSENSIISTMQVLWCLKTQKLVQIFLSKNIPKFNWMIFLKFSLFKPKTDEVR